MAASANSAKHPSANSKGIPVDVKNEIDEIYRQTQKKRSDVAFQYFGRVVAIFTVPAVIGVFGWLANLHSHVEANADRITIIEKTQFTAEQGYQMESRILQFIEQRYSPKWLESQLNRLEVSVKENTKKLEDIRERITRIEGR